MFKKLSIALALVLTLTMVISTSAAAEEQGPDNRVRVRGRIGSINLNSQMFTLITGDRDEVRVQVSQETQFRSPSGQIQGLEDLEDGMGAIVAGVQHGQGLVEAVWVAAVNLGDERPELRRSQGEITGVDLGAQTFSLASSDGESLSFQTNDRTHFKGTRDSISGLDDLEVGMRAMVGAIEADGDFPLAVVVIAASPEDIPENSFRMNGTIASIVPGQDTFTLVNSSDETVEILTSERTRFTSRDGSVHDIHDLERDMRVGVGGLIQEDGTHMALVVIAGPGLADQGGNPSNRPARNRLGGQVISVGGSSFTLEKLDGGQVTVSVNENTVFRSRQDGVNSLSDLQTGMIVLVSGAVDEQGGILASWVGAGMPKGENGRPDN